MSTATKRPGVTLVEILVVIGIMGLLMGLLLPAVQGVRGRASQMRCLDNLRQIGLAMHNYESAHGTLPPAQTRIAPNHFINWMVTLLPYIEQDDLYRRTVEASRLDPSRFNDPPHIGLKTVIRTYICPADGRLTSPITDDQGYTAAYSSYMGMMGGIIKLPVTGNLLGIMTGTSAVRLTDITDGTSQTVAVGERTPPGRLFVGSWYNPGTLFLAWDFDGYERGMSMGALKSYNEGRCRGPFPFGPGRIENPCDSNHFWSLHPGGANFLFADGSVRFLSYSAAAILPALATRAGGEVINWP